MTQKILLCWHFKLGHLGFVAVQWLGQQGFFGPQGEAMGHARFNSPKCGMCLLGKQHKTANPAKHVQDKASGELMKDVLQPGQVIFSNQYQMLVAGKAMQNKDGSNKTQSYKGGTVFCDGTSGYIHMEHQVGLNTYETIASKLIFEWTCIKSGVTVTLYHTDNGIYWSSEFLKELHSKWQGIKMSGVSTQFQNGVAENAIKNTVTKACTLMLHLTLR